MRTAIVATATGDILVLDPPLDDQGNVILPEGIATQVVTLTAQQEAAIDAAAAASAAAIQTAQTAANDLRAQILALAQSSVGVTLSALTTAQRSALTACLLFKAGGVTDDMKVKALNLWLT